MRPRDVFDIILLGSMWGASFLFMRMSSTEFGPFPIAAIRVTVAAITLTPLFLMTTSVRELRGRMGIFLAISLINTTIPFVLLAYATQHITSGFAAILNSTAPMWGAVISYVWLRESLNGIRILGLLVGSAGVFVFVWGRTTFDPAHSSFAIAAVLCSTFLYGFGANFSRRYLTGIHPMAAASGSIAVSALMLAPLALFSWPDHPVSQRAWISVIALGMVCTGVPYVLYFRLIRSVGPVRTVSVTFLVPLFAVIWGALLLGEKLTISMGVGGLIILLGTGLATGLIRPPIRNNDRAVPNN